MIQVRKREDRGHFDHGWLETSHSFSFAGYFDPQFVGFRALRVLNEDRVAPGAGFPTHAHQDMEILTYVLEGALEHSDSMGTGSVIRPGDVQRMTAGRGVTHSEFNASKTHPLHFLQIWIHPSRSRLDPGYEQKTFSAEEKRGRLRLVASSDGRDGSLTIHQDADVYASILEPGNTIRFEPREGRFGWIQIARGEAVLNGNGLRAGDGAGWTDESSLELTSEAGAEILLFDLA